MIVGEASVRILADDKDFDQSLEAGTAPGFGKLKDDAELAGEDAGAGLGGGLNKGIEGAYQDANGKWHDANGKFISDAEATGALGGQGIRTGLNEGLTDAERDAEEHGGNIGGKLTEALKKSMAGLGGVLGAVGLDFGPFAAAADASSGKLDKVGESADKSGGFLNSLGKATVVAGVGGLAVFSAAALKMGMDFQQSVATMAAQGNIPINLANQIGTAMLHTGDNAIYSASQQVQAYGAIAGQLAAVEGHTLSVGQVTSFMGHSMDLAEESGQSLGSTTKVLSQTMQAFQIPLNQVGTLTTQLFNAARITGTGIDALSSTMDRMKARLGVTAPSVSDLSTLLVDVGEHGVTGSRGLMVVNTALNTLLKPSADAIKAQSDLKAATDALPPSLQKLATEYQAGNITAKQVTDGTKNLTLAQADQWKAFTSASDAVNKASSSMSEAGVVTTNAQGKFVGMGSIIAQLQDKLKGQTQAQQLATLATVFGANANKALLDTVLAGPAAYDKAQKAINDSAAAHHALVVQQETLKHEFEAIKTSAENMATSFGEKLLPIVKDALTDFGHFIGYLEDHKPLLDAIAVLIGGVLATAVGVFAINTGQKMVNSVKSAVESLGKLFGAGQSQVAVTEEQTGANESLQAALDAVAASQQAVIEGAQMLASIEAEQLGVSTELAAALTETAGAEAAAAVAADGLAAGFDASAEAAAGADAAMDANPIGIIVLAIAALVIGIIELVKHWKDVKHWFDEGWSDIKKVFDDGVKFVKGHWKDFLEALVVLATGGIALLPVLIFRYWDKIKTDAIKAWDDIVSFLESIGSKILNAFSAAGTWLYKVGETILHGLWTGIQDGWKALGSIGSTILGWFTTGIGDVTKWLYLIGKKILDGLWQGLKDEWAGLGTIGTTIWNWFLTGIGDVTHWLYMIGSKILDGLWKGLKDEWAGLGDIGSTIEKWFTSALSDAANWLVSAGGDVISGLVNGIEDAAGDVGKALMKIAGNAVHSVLSFFGIGSPSKMFHDIGGFLMQGLANGITDAGNLPVSALTSVNSQVGTGAANLTAGFGGGSAASGAPSVGTGGGNTVTIQAGAFQVHVHGAADPGVVGAATQATQQGLSALTETLNRGTSGTRLVPA